MATISLCMIVKNEEPVLERCLKSVRDAVDEIIIVDTGSTDATKDIARQFTDRIFDLEWIDDFSAARNFAYSHASMDYQMWLDADDVIPPEELQKLLELKEVLEPSADMVTMKYHTHFAADGTPVLTSTRERLTKREKHYRWQDPVHECIPLQGNVVHSDIVIRHQKPPSNGAISARNLAIYQSLEEQGKTFTPRQLYYFARELKDHRQWAKAAYYFDRFLSTGQGWAEDNIAACFNLAACYKALGDNEKALPVLLRAFTYGSPRAEICCQIGYYYKHRNEYQTALSWFRVAVGLESSDSLGFVLQDYHGFIPNIESCVCCCYLKQYQKAAEYNESAGKFRPEHPSVIQNRKYLASVQALGKDENGAAVLDD